MGSAVVYKLRFDSKWLIGSAVMMGVAFFLQAFDFLGLRMMQGLGILQMVLYLILPMLLEAAWCVLIRCNIEDRAKIVGMIGACLCLVLFVQTLFCGKLLLIFIGGLSLLIAGAALVLVTWGFIPHRHLGFLVLAAVVLIRVLLFGVVAHVLTLNWSALLQEIPVICNLVAMMYFFGGIYPMKNE